MCIVNNRVIMTIIIINNTAEFQLHYYKNNAQKVVNVAEL